MSLGFKRLRDFYPLRSVHNATVAHPGPHARCCFGGGKAPGAGDSITSVYCRGWEWLVIPPPPYVFIAHTGQL